MSKKLDFLAIILLLAVGLAVYSNSLQNQFVWDDLSFIVRNDAIKSIGNIGSFFTNAATLAKGEISRDTYRPLVALSFSLDYFFWKLDPFYYHLENILLHIINSILLYLLMRYIVGNAAGAFLVSLLFLVHPAQTEVVDWISRRGDVFGLFLYLSAFLIHIRLMKKPDNRQLLLYISMIACFAAAILFKETAITLPLILIFYSRNKSIRYYAPFIAVAALYAIARLNVVGPIAERGWWGRGPLDTFLTMTIVLVKYVKILVFPYDLSADYILRLANGFDLRVAASMAILALVIISAILLRKKERLFTFGVYWFFISLIPVLQIFPIKMLMANRFLYTPSIGFFMCLAGVVATQEGLAKKGAYLCLCALTVSYCFTTVGCNKEWKDELTFFKINSERSQNSPLMHFNLGSAYISKGMADEAIKEFEKAVSLKAGLYEGHCNLGYSYLSKGNIDKAVASYKNAIAASPTISEAYFGLGNVYFEKGDYAAAAANYKKALTQDKDRPEIRSNLSLATSRLREPGKI